MPTIEEFVIEKTNYNVKMVYCHKRNLTLMVGEHLETPNYPPHLLLAFATITKKPNGEPLGQPVIIIFGVIDDEKIDYEPYFRHLLISNAINYYIGEEWGKAYDYIDYSDAYKKQFIDSMTLDPKKMSPELRSYVKRDDSEEALDFYEWKEKHLKPFLN